jgi:hypothetical protein
MSRERSDPSEQGPHPASPVNPNPAAFFEIALGACQEAQEAAGGPVDRFYSIGGLALRLRFAGRALIPLIAPALEHLFVQPVEAPAFTIHLWDSVSSGTTMPAAPWSLEDYGPRGEVRGYGDERFHTVFHLGSHTLKMLDARQNVGLFWIRDARDVPFYESAAPLQAILHRWMGMNGHQLLHAGAVGMASGGVLLAGRGGSGKTSTALACVFGGLLYAGDDYVLLSDEGVPLIYSLYNSAKLDPDNLDRFPHLAERVVNSDRLDTEKAVVFLHQHWPEQVSSGFALRAIAVVRVGGGRRTEISAAPSAMALKALAPSTVLQLSGAGQCDFRRIASLVERVPCFSLDLGTEPDEIARTISTLLPQLQESDGASGLGSSGRGRSDQSERRPSALIARGMGWDHE